MPPLRIQLAVLGQPPPDFDARELLDWKSRVFEIHPHIESYQLNEDSGGEDWQFTDQQLEKYIRRDPSCDLLVILVKVKLQYNWYLRRLSDNRVLFTFYELDQILRFHGLPLKNLALRVFYGASLVYRRYGDRIPPASEDTNYAHDETRGCLFDMNAEKMDVIHSLHQPRLCEYCISQLKLSRVSNELVQAVQSELRRIKKPLIDRIANFIRAHTIWSIVLSILSAIILGTLTSLLATLIYESLLPAS